MVDAFLFVFKQSVSSREPQNTKSIPKEDCYKKGEGGPNEDLLKSE